MYSQHLIATEDTVVMIPGTLQSQPTKSMMEDSHNLVKLTDSVLPEIHLEAHGSPPLSSDVRERPSASFFML